MVDVWFFWNFLWSVEDACDKQQSRCRSWRRSRQGVGVAETIRCIMRERQSLLKFKDLVWPFFGGLIHKSVALG